MNKKIRKALPLLFIFALVLVFLAALLMKPGMVELEYEAEYPACTEGATQHCCIGNCSGKSTCVNGKWGPCKLDIVCRPGETVPCLERGCVTGHKECNECGTAYGPCIRHD
ncbi:hypothetical protein GF318_03030 [Candidatus Micrarchaeota archaeon]|nr:hypothetical protein [Candidatus Micrarchaeota archaeon]